MEPGVPRELQTPGQNAKCRHIFCGTGCYRSHLKMGFNFDYAKWVFRLLRLPFFKT